MSVKYYHCELTKEQKDVVIDALSRMKCVLPVDATYRGKVAAVLYHFQKLQPYKVRKGF
jgi:hypothetical protein